MADARQVGVMLAIIPARGGSRELRRKNTRTLAGKPVVLWALDNVRAALPDARIICTTDDPTVATIAYLHGYEVMGRPPELADEHATVQQVAAWVVSELGWEGPVGVFQPTSPTLRPETIAMAVQSWETPYGSLSSVVPEPHTFRSASGGLLTPIANRQDRAPLWRETGGIQLARRVPAEGSAPESPLVAAFHQTFLTPLPESIDIDTAADLVTAGHVLGRKTVTFVVTGGTQTGSGHVRRCLALADELGHHHVRFVWAHEQDTDLMAQIDAAGYGRDPNSWLEADLVIFDRLDTSVRDVAQAKAHGAAVMCLEDLGPGAALADVVVNELYNCGAKIGPRYAVLRPEFLALPPHPIRDVTRDQLNVLVTFGGTDPANLVARCEKVLQATAANILTVGPDDVMARKMHDADLVVTSCGRTVHEAAAVGVPTIAIAANARESRHSLCPGVVYLGLHVTVPDRQIWETADAILGDLALRLEMSQTMRNAVDGRGARRIAHLAEGLLEGL